METELTLSNGSKVKIRKSVTYGEVNAIEAVLKKGATMAGGEMSVNMESEERFTIKMILTFVKKIINKEGEEKPFTEEVLTNLDFKDGFEIQKIVVDLFSELKKNVNVTQ